MGHHLQQPAPVRVASVPETKVTFTHHKTSRVMNRITLYAALLVLASARPAPAQPRLLDDFEALSGWHPVVSDGAALKIISGDGKIGKAMVMDFELIGVYGYVIAEKDL